MGQKALPGWVAPFLGAIIGAFFAAKQVANEEAATQTKYAIIGALLGLTAGTVIWVIELLGGRRRK